MSSPTFAGREEELARLREVAEQAAGGDPALVLVGGDAGIGKTRLVTEAASSLDGTTTLIGGCLQLGAASVPYVPLAEMLRQLARDRGDDGVRTLLTGERNLLRRLLPGESRAAADQPLPERSASSQLHGAVLSLFETLAEEVPLLVVIEDLHWASTSTLDLVTFLGRNLSHGRVAVVGTFRTDEMHRRHPLRPVLAELGRMPGVERLDLAPLSAHQQRQQVAAILGGPPTESLLQEVIRRSEGNPFYAEELLAVSADDRTDLPPALRDILTQRVADLPDESQRILRITAAAGREVDHELLEQVADLDDDALGNGLRRAVEHGILLTDGPGYRFRHALLQEAVHDELLPGERVQLHTTLVEVLTERPELAANGVAGADAEIAHHAHEALLVDRAYTASLRAADRAASSYAFPQALEHFEAALSLREQVDEDAKASGPDLVEILRRAAQVAGFTGRHQRAVGHLRTALEKPSVAGVDRAELMGELSFQEGFHGRLEESRETLVRALELARDPSAVRVDLLGWLAVVTVVLGRVDEVAAPAREAIALVEKFDAPAGHAWAANALGGALVQLGDVEKGIEQLRTSVEVARTNGLIEAALAGYNNLADWLRTGTSGAHEMSLATGLEGLEYAESEGWTGIVTDYLRLIVVQLRIDRGELEQAESLYARARVHWEAGQFLGHWLRTGAELRLEQGRADDAAHLFEQASDAWGRVTEPQHAYALTALRARVAHARGDLEKAWQILDDGMQEPVVLSSHDPVRPLAAQVVADQVAAGCEVDKARERLDGLRSQLDGMLDDEDESSHWAAQLRTAITQVEAERTRALGEPDPEIWKRAEDGVAAQERIPGGAYLRIRRAEALVSVDRRDEAAELLQSVHSMCMGRGLVALSEQAETLARRARIRLDGTDTGTEGDPFGLTPRELEVLALVVDGLTNRQVGEQLFVSAKTVSVHLSNAMRKLGASNRTEAAAIARRHGLD